MNTKRSSSYDPIAAAYSRMATLDAETPRRVTSGERAIGRALAGGVQDGQREWKRDQRGSGFAAYRRGN